MTVMTRRLLLCGIATCLLVLLWALMPVATEPPRSWSLEEIARQAPPYGSEGRTYVLAWQIWQDDRPLRVESCLVLKVSDKDPSAVLSHLFRHPDQEKPEWELGMTHVSEDEFGPVGHWIYHQVRFDTRPTNKEIYAALSMKGVDWSFDVESGTVACNVCEKNWLEAIGEKPTQFFRRSKWSIGRFFGFE